jgi:hypothetical protein
LAINSDAVQAGRSLNGAITRDRLPVYLTSTVFHRLRSPPELLQEIVLVDDGSDKPWLQQELADYVKLLPKTR